MRTVYKYPLQLVDEQILAGLPHDFHPLHVAEQLDGLFLWAEVDPQEGPEYRPEAKWAIRVAGTGHPLGAGWSHENYVGTAHLYGRQLVFHVYAKRVQ